MSPEEMAARLVAIEADLLRLLRSVRHIKEELVKPTIDKR